MLRCIKNLCNINIKYKENLFFRKNNKIDFPKNLNNKQENANNVKNPQDIFEKNDNFNFYDKKEEENYIKKANFYKNINFVKEKEFYSNLFFIS